MRSWKVRQLRLQLEFLLFFFSSSPTLRTISVWHLSQHTMGRCPPGAQFHGPLKFFHHLVPNIYQQFAIQRHCGWWFNVHKGARPQTDYSWQWGVTRRNITRMRCEVWDTEAQRTWVLSSPLYHLSHLLIVSLLILSVWPSHSCEWSYPSSNRSPVNVSNPGHSSYPSPNHSVAALMAFETNMFQVTLTIFLPPTTPSWWKASSFTLNTFLFLTPQI